ncbi:chitin synthase chs-2-like [Mytilus californianus]|uniref:chitin synthase chs-2-like n=1 Tax=Mytilus californianus TaxID=6549 RepID=UPI00224500EC|nr:chitin synthase chs-2-like [Mytilus californianus]
MIIVLIGVTRDAVNEGWCSITTVFLLFVAGIFVITALLHPKELFCLIPGLLYFVAIPSMSMLMFFYSIGNMHVVSWGTREYEQVSKSNKEIMDSGYFCSFGNFISCMLCADNSYKKEDFLNAEMNKRIAKDKTEKTPSEDIGIQVEMSSSQSTIDQETQTDVNSVPFVNKEIQVDLPLLPKQTKNKRMQVVMFFEKYSQDKFKKDQTLHRINEQEDPSQQWPELWEDDKYHLYFNDYVPKIETSEFKFWERNISRYLKPIQRDHATEQQLQCNLLSLRNRVSLFVFLVNAVLVTTMYSLTQANTFKDSLAIKIECSSKNLQIAPIALLFTIVFGFLLLLQFLCMLYHRFSTLIHITASTSLIHSKEYLLEVAYRELLESLMSPGHYHKRSEEISKSDKDRELLATQRKIDIPKHEKMESIGEMVTKNIESSKLKSLPEAVKILGVIKTWQKKIKHPAKDSIKTSDAHPRDNEAETSIKPVHDHVEDKETVVKTVY